MGVVPCHAVQSNLVDTFAYECVILMTEITGILAGKNVPGSLHCVQMGIGLYQTLRHP